MDPVKNLIQMVRERRAIWDKNCDEYRDKAAKDRAWIEIYRQMEPTYDSLQHMMKNQIGSQITKKWYNVRDSYRKSLKSNNKRPRPYIYSDLLSFLGPLLEKTMNDSIDPDEVDMENDQQAASLNNVFVDIDEELIVDGAKSFQTDVFANKDNTEKLNDDVVTVLANIIQKEEDEDRAFFKSITPIVKTLSDETKMEFRIQVMKLIRKLKMWDKNQIRVKGETIVDDSD